MIMTPIIVLAALIGDAAGQSLKGEERSLQDTSAQQFRDALNGIDRSRRVGVRLFRCRDNNRECEFGCKAGYVLANPNEKQLQAKIKDGEVEIPAAISSLCVLECIPVSYDEYTRSQEARVSYPPEFRDDVVKEICLVGERCNEYASRQSSLCHPEDDPCRSKNDRCNGGTCVNVPSETGTYDYKCECPDNFVGKDCEIERDETQACEDKESTPAQIANNEDDTELTQCMEDACVSQPGFYLCKRWKSTTYNTCEKLVGYGYCDSVTRPEMRACCSSSCGWCGAPSSTPATSQAPAAPQAPATPRQPACFVNGSLANHCAYVQQESMANDCANGSSPIVNGDECKAVGRSYKSLDVTIMDEDVVPSFILEERPGGCFSSPRGWGFNPTKGGGAVGRHLICSVQTLCSDVADGLNSLCIDSVGRICKKEFANTGMCQSQSSQGEPTFTYLVGGAPGAN